MTAAAVLVVGTTGEDEATLLNLKGSSSVHTPYLMRKMPERERQ